MDVITDAADKEVSGRVLTAQGNLVPVALALANRSAWHIAQHIGKAVMGLVVQLLTRHNIDCLWNIKQRRVGFGRGYRIGCDITVINTGDDDLG